MIQQSDQGAAVAGSKYTTRSIWAHTLWSAAPWLCPCSLSVPALSSFPLWLSVPVQSACGDEPSSSWGVAPSPISPFTIPAVLSLVSCLSSFSFSCSIGTSKPLSSRRWASCNGAGERLSWNSPASAFFWWVRWAGLQLGDLLLIGFSMLQTGTEETKEVKRKSAWGCSIKRKKREKEVRLDRCLPRAGDGDEWERGRTVEWGLFSCASLRVKNKTVEVCRLLSQATESCCISEQVRVCVCLHTHAKVRRKQGKGTTVSPETALTDKSRCRLSSNVPRWVWLVLKWNKQGETLVERLPITHTHTLTMLPFILSTSCPGSCSSCFPPSDPQRPSTAWTAATVSQLGWTPSVAASPFLTIKRKH